MAVTSAPTSGADTTPPILSSLSPATTSGNVGVGVNLVANFNEAILAGTGNINIATTPGGVPFASIPVGDPQITISGGTVTINPTADLAPGTGYSVTMASGVIKDLAGNNFAGLLNTSDWTFTTDGSAPTVTSTSPANGATGIQPPTSLQITFNENVVLVGGKYITVKKLSDNSEPVLIIQDF